MDKEIKVLDKGFVRLVDTMGNDSSIVQAARVSYGSGTKHVSEDENLIRYLMRNRHTTPFEMCEIKFHIKVPMDCWRQWIRHRTANVNEYSTRYSLAIDDTQETLPTKWRIQSNNNKQGSDGFIDGFSGESLSAQEKQLHVLSKQVYANRLTAGIAREQARKDLPLSTYTEAYWKIDLHNLFHFLSLRMDSHAQYEIRQYANAIAQLVSEWVPIAYKAFEDYRLNSMYLSGRDIEIMNKIVTIPKLKQDYIIETREFERKNPFGWFTKKENGSYINNRERIEFENKMHRLGIEIPWLNAD